MNVVGVIPARMGSTRFPGKPMARIRNMTMIEHVYRRSALSPLLSDLYVATCDQEIADEVRRFGGKVKMTAASHTRCTDRIAEAAQGLTHEIVINIQGDEPLLEPRMLDLVAQPLIDDSSLSCATLMRTIQNATSESDTNVVKVVFDRFSNALYFSRAAIPTSALGRRMPLHKQMGIMAFRRDFLLEFARLPETPLEQAESVDLMRAVENGFKVRVVESPYEATGVDRPQDLQAVELLMQNDPLYARYTAPAAKIL